MSIMFDLARPLSSFHKVVALIDPTADPEIFVRISRMVLENFPKTYDLATEITGMLKRLLQDFADDRRSSSAEQGFRATRRNVEEQLAQWEAELTRLVR
jgi:hypothetical protein